MRRLLLGALLGLFLLGSLALSGCGSTQQAASSSDAPFATIHDALGRDVELAKKPSRIVVTSASFLEPLHEVGGDVVGRPDSKTKMPAYAKDKASVGKVYQIDLEKVLACEPDLVILNKGMNEKLVSPLEQNGIKTLVLDMKSYDDVKAEVRALAMVTGEREKGESLIASMDERIADVRAKIPQEARRVSIIHSTNQGLTVQLDGSIAGCTANLLGWQNVASGTAPLEKNPDITSMGDVAEAKAGMDSLMQDSPAWQTIAAVREGRVYYLPQDLFLLSPGIHYPEAVASMAKCLYPEAFE